MEDHKIIALYWSRNEEAIEKTSRKYGPYCHAVARNILNSDQDCEECVNDTWLRTWTAIPPQKPGNLRMFLARITRNLALDRFKALTAQKRNAEMTVVLEELEECLGDPTTPETTLEAKELSQAVNRFVKELPAREGDVFIRRYFFAESASVIGKKYGISPGNVTVILSRTRKKLRARLQKEGYLDE